MSRKQLPDLAPEVIHDLGHALQVRRVLWMIAMGFNRPHSLTFYTDPDAVKVAVDHKLVAEPMCEEFPYMLTDTGRRAIEQWFRQVGPRTDDPVFKAFWEAVTLR